MKSLGESRSQAVRRFLSLERALRAKDQFKDVEAVMREYFEMGHAEKVPGPDLEKSQEDVYYLPMHVVRKDSPKYVPCLTRLRSPQPVSLSTTHCWLDPPSTLSTD